MLRVTGRIKTFSIAHLIAGPVAASAGTAVSSDAGARTAAALPTLANTASQPHWSRYRLPSLLLCNTDCRACGKCALQLHLDQHCILRPVLSVSLIGHHDWRADDGLASTSAANSGDVLAALLPDIDESLLLDDMNLND